MTSPDLNLSRALNAIAEVVDKVLRGTIGGGRVPFVLMAAPSENVQYVANVRREDGIKLIKSLLERWGNPADIPDLAQHQKDELLLRLLAAAKAYHQALDMSFAMLIEATRGAEMPAFMPSQSPMWPAIAGGKAVIDEVDAVLAASRELSAKGTMPAPDPERRH